jgi:hypothetical protein
MAMDGDGGVRVVWADWRPGERAIFFAAMKTDAFSFYSKPNIESETPTGPKKTVIYESNCARLAGAEEVVAAM